MMRDPAQPPHVRHACVWRIKSSLRDRFVEHRLVTWRFRYEDLVSDPSGVCRHLAAEAGIRFVDDMLSHEDVFVGHGPGETARTRPVDTSSIEKWRSELTAHQVSDIVTLARSEMVALGYPVDPS
jgi:hypothetical protein